MKKAIRFVFSKIEKLNPTQRLHIDTDKPMPAALQDDSVSVDVTADGKKYTGKLNKT